MRDNLIGTLRARTARLVAALRTGAPFAALVALIIPFPAYDARAQDILRWKLKPGDVLKYSIDQKVMMDAKQMGRSHKQTRNHTIDYVWNVKNVSANGEAEIAVKISRLTMKVAMPPLMPFEFDSNSPKSEVPEAFETELQMTKATIGAEILFTMKPSGEIADVKIPEPTLKKLRDALPKEAPNTELSEQVLKDGLIQSSPPPFPEQALEVGKNWSSKPSKVPFPPLFTMVTDKVCTFQGPDPKNPRLMLIGMDERVTLEPGEDVSAKIRSQDGKGSLTFDAEGGHMVNSRLNHKLEVLLSKMGQEIELTNETSATTTLVP
jgi:hypothetical protein